MKTIYRDWPDSALASELFAMRQAVEEHPEDAYRWRDRLALAEYEAKKRVPKRRRQPLGMRIAEALVGDRDQDGEWVDWHEGARLVIVDDNGIFWGLNHAGLAHRLDAFRPGHLRCILRSRRTGQFIATEWEYPTSTESREAGR